VVDYVKVSTTTDKEKVGDTVYKDSEGNTVGSSATYAEREHTHVMKVWYPVQGHGQLADEDFFRIAGDQESVDATQRMRDAGKKWHHRGKYFLAGGFAGMIAAIFIPVPVARVVLTLGGVTAATAGYYMMFWGAGQMAPETHAVDRSLADHDADQYNRQLSGRPVGVSVARSF